MLALIGSMFWFQAGFGLFLLFLILNGVVYFIRHRKIERMLEVFRYAGDLIGCAGRLLADQELPLPQREKIVRALAVLRPFRSALPAAARNTIGDFDALFQYVRILFLSDLIAYSRRAKLLKNHADDFRLLYETVGWLDSAQSVLSFVKSLPLPYCEPRFHQENRIEAHGLYHPLLAHPVSNDITFKRGAIITGANASGKSTFIKAVAVNQILAASIGICTAADFTTRDYRVISSMAVRDHLQEGESYFVAEVKSLKRILDESALHPCLCLVDEILRGTNAEERIAASTAVMQALAREDGICIVASHDLELAERVKEMYEQYYFTEQMGEDEIFFDYTIRPGVSHTQNAIQLLEMMGFDTQITQAARAARSGKGRRPDDRRFAVHKGEEKKMSQETYLDSIKEQTRRALWEVENVIACIPDALWDRAYGAMPLSKHVYHMLHSLDLWLINPRDPLYKEPDFHERDLNNLDVVSAKRVSREQIVPYYAGMKQKIFSYLEQLTDDSLLDKPAGCEYTRLTLILAQHRHLHTHMGMIMGFLVADSGRWPLVLGLENPFPAEGRFGLFY